MPAQLIRCKMCEQEGSSARAHVIPDSLYAGAKRDNRITHVEYGQGLKDRQIQSGVWDRTILCQECERRFAYLDTYATRVFREETFPPQPSPLTTGLYSVLRGVDHTKIKRFLLFAAWRIGTSSRPEFRSINLGNHMQELRRLILDDDLPILEPYPIVIVRRLPTTYTNSSEIIQVHPKQFVFMPALVDFARRATLRIPLSDYTAFVALDDQPLSRPWLACAVGAWDELLVLDKPLDQDPDFKQFIRTLLSS